MSRRTFQFRVVMPECVVDAMDVLSLTVPAVDGRLTVLAGHQPLVCAVSEGVCYLRGTGPAHAAAAWHCSDGTLEVESQGDVVLLVRRWEPVSSASAGTEALQGPAAQEGETQDV